MEPRRRVGIAHVAEQERPVFEREQFLHSRDLWGRDRGFILAIQIDAREFYLIAKLRDLLPRSIWPEQIMREVPAIAVRYRRENMFAVVGCREGDLRDSWEVFSDRILVLCVRGAELVKVNLLIKIEI